MNLCLLIPNYNHGASMDRLLSKLEAYGLDCLIVDDGSDYKTKEYLRLAEEKFSWVSVLTLPRNKGKGAAVKAGFQKLSHEKKFTHVLQIDADEQHEVKDIPRFINAMKANSKAVINGVPVYDKTAPKSRVYGRKITNFWVAIETWSRDIEDAMCGYRVYPLKETMECIRLSPIDNGMSFDIQIIVQLYWSGLSVISLPCQVSYPTGGISHFKMWEDNLKISWAHTRLFFGMLARIPRILQHKIHHRDHQHWSQIKERGSLWGLRFMLKSYQVIGRRITQLFLYPLIAYFYCINTKAKKASKLYLSKVEQPTTRKFSSFKHFFEFGSASLDTLSAWHNDIPLEAISFPNDALLENALSQKKGGVALTAHLGNIEIARALSRLKPSLKINAVVFRENARKFNSVIEQINPEFNFNIISVSSFSAALAMTLKEKIEAGEFIVIVADRTSTTIPGRVIQADFFGQPANFPMGPFVLASALSCPVYFLLCLKEEKQHFKIIFEQLAEGISMKREERETDLKIYAEKYARLLEHYCKQYPLQWFNFFDFWKTENLGKIKQRREIHV